MIAASNGCAISTKVLPKVSVIIPAFNAASTISRCIASLADTEYPNLEIVVVDDGSSDSTKEVARNVFMQSQFGSTVMLHHGRGENKGASASRNLGLSKSTGDFICFLDADDTVNTWRFDCCIKLLATDHSLDAVYECAALRFDDETERLVWPSISTIFGLTQDLLGDELLKALIEGQPWHTSAITIRRSLLSRTGAFDESLIIAEDCNLWMRMAVAGKVVPGNLTIPVSNYWRRPGSLYRPALERKLDFFLALLRFSSWVNSTSDFRSKSKYVDSVIAPWIDNAYIQFRQSARFDLVLKLSRMVLMQAPRFCIPSKTYAHLAHSTWESHRRRGVGP